MARVRSDDPILNYKYSVKFSAIPDELGTAGASFLTDVGVAATVIGFNKITGIGSELSELKFGTGDGIDRKVPGKRTIKDITLERPMMEKGKQNILSLLSVIGLSDQLLGFSGFRFNMVIDLNSSIQPGNQMVASWSYTDCWIKTYDGPDLDAEGDAFATEKVTIVAEQLSTFIGSLR